MPVMALVSYGGNDPSLVFNIYDSRMVLFGSKSNRKSDVFNKQVRSIVWFDDALPFARMSRRMNKSIFTIEHGTPTTYIQVPRTVGILLIVKVQ